MGKVVFDIKAAARTGYESYFKSSKKGGKGKKKNKDSNLIRNKDSNLIRGRNQEIRKSGRKGEIKLVL